jgi:HK97 family phage major capsid protein
MTTTTTPRGHEFTYRQDGRFSYLQDRVTADKNTAARARLDRHAQEVDAYRADLVARASRTASNNGVEARINPSLITGQGGELAPPAWVIDKFASVPRPARVLARLAKSFPLPPHAQSVNVPVMTVGTSTGWQGNDNTSDVETDVTTTSEFSEVVTISGQADVAMQLLELSPLGASLDEMFFSDMSEAYDATLEAQLLYGPGGTGAQAQLLGILNATGINAVTYTDASPTGHAMYPLIGQAVAQVGKNRKLPPEVFLMTSRRWGWLRTSEDLQDLPFDFPELNGADNPLCPGAIAGFPVWLSDAIPSVLTAGLYGIGNGTQDVIIACRPSDIYLFEANPLTSTFVDVTSGTLEARLTFRNYVAALTSRYVTSVAVVSGTGMATQTGF